MRIAKSLLIKVGIASFLITLLFSFGIFLISQKEYPVKVNCISKSNLYFYKKCGYIVSTPNNKFHKIVGIIESKSTKENTKIINLITQNSSGSSILIPVYIYPDPIPKNLTVISSNDEMKISSIAAQTEIVNNAESLFNSLDVNEEIIVNIFTPDKSDLIQAKNAYGNLKELNCNKYQELMVKYLSESSVLNNLSAQINKLTSGCNIYTLQVEKIKT